MDRKWRCSCKEGLENVRKYYGKFRLKYKNSENEDSYHYVINATGPKMHLSELNEDEHFIKGLENKQIIAPHPFWWYFSSAIF